MTDEKRTITDDELRDKVAQKRRDAGLPEDSASSSADRGGTPADGKLGEAIAGWSETEERETDCVAKKAACEGHFTQRRPKIHKGRAWKQPICPTCQSQLDTAVAEADIREQRQRSLSSRLTVLEVPPLYAEVSLDDFEMHGDEANQTNQAQIVELCRRFVDRWPEVPPITLFMGGPGTGKGHLAWAIAKSIVTEKGDAVRFASYPDLIRELRESWSHPGLADTEEIVLERYREPPLLIIDEVSRHAYYGQPTAHLYHLINHRENWLRPTILITNEDADGLSEALTDPVLSRIEGGGAVWDFGRVDYRRRESKQSWL